MRALLWLVLAPLAAVTALAAATAAPAAADAARAGTAVAARADDDAFIELNPDTTQAGRTIGIRARCTEDDDRQPADVRSRAFPDVTVHPQPGSKLLTGSVTIPHDTKPGDYPVHLRCPSSASASTKVHVLDMARPTVGPPTGGGGTANGPPAALPLLAGGGAALALGAGLLLRRRTA